MDVPDTDAQRNFILNLSPAYSHETPPRAGQPTPSSESSEVRWVPVADIPRYTMDRSMRIRINDFLARDESQVII
jgi:hypothetical protein